MLRVDGKFLTSAARAEQFLRPQTPVIAVAGKSNSGKSSLINMLAGRKNLAKTSGTPGRTRLVNYFDFGPFVLADLPGYGFAAVSKAEKEKWADLLDAFFDETDVAHVFVLSDVRRDPSADDVQMLSFLASRALPFTVVATKADKLSRMKQKEQRKKIADSLRLGEGNVVLTSAASGQGRDELLGKIETVLSVV